MICYVLYMIYYILYIMYYRSEGLPRALFFPGRDWSWVWLRLDARRLAVPKDSRYGPPPGHVFVKNMLKSQTSGHKQKTEGAPGDPHLAFIKTNPTSGHKQKPEGAPGDPHLAFIQTNPKSGHKTPRRVRRGIQT